ncbi:hypothetical protein BH10PSE2_BH10PSE2_01880 [soil metagenome]
MTSLKIAVLAGLTALLPALAPNWAMAQNASLAATRGQSDLTTGFTPDPQEIGVTAGGPIEASNLGGSCVGMISNAPTYLFTYTAGTTFPLFIRTQSDTDTTLVVYAPDGNWYCDDDSAGSSNAQVRYNTPLSGAYRVWVGSYSGGSPSATLQISELDADSDTDDAASTEQPDSSLRPTYGEIDLSSGFVPDPRRLSLRAGGTIQASNVSSDCTGLIASAPDYRIQYTAGSQPLIISTRSDTDTTLVINGPNGNWVCDDDSGGGSDASVVFEKPASGAYDVWIGTYGGGLAAATLILTERQ